MKLSSEFKKNQSTFCHFENGVALYIKTPSHNLRDETRQLIIE
jgi:hypothetical protein